MKLLTPLTRVHKLELKERDLQGSPVGKVLAQYAGYLGFHSQYWVNMYSGTVTLGCGRGRQEDTQGHLQVHRQCKTKFVPRPVFIVVVVSGGIFVRTWFVARHGNRCL